MIGDYGFKIFGQSNTPTTKDPAYDSAKGRLQTSLIASPPHLALIKDFKGGTPLFAADGERKREILLTIPHGKKYTPEAVMYFYVQSYNGSITDPKAGVYAGNIIFYSGSSGVVEDKILLEVDAKNLYVVHQVDNFLLSAGYTSDADKYLLRLKYYIFSNQSHVDSFSFGHVVR